MSIEDDIKRCKELIKPEHSNWIGLTNQSAIKIILGNLEALCDMQKSADRELENAKKINEEHRKENADLMKAINVVEKEKGEWIEDCNNLKKKVKELEEENGTLKRVNNIIKNIDIENATQKIDDYYNEFMRNFIPTQKIKDKIEELNRKEQDLQNSITEEEREEYSDANISFQLCDIEIRREVLQELLQESEDK